LLHPILGHEVGHAIWRCSKHQGFLRSQVVSALKEPGGLFASSDVTANHVFSTLAPAEAKAFLNVLSGIGIDQTNLFRWADWDAWIEEILCDLIGLASFGPGFVAALCELLYGLDPSGVGFGDQHPPVGWRVNLVLRAATLLGYDALPEPQHALLKPLEQFWKKIAVVKATDPWFDIFTDAQLQTALTSIESLLSKHPPSSYTIPKFETVHRLFEMLQTQIPPVGFSLNAAGIPTCSQVDFRHIIYAGWIASQQESPINFDLINRLCQHAIMQQSAIDLTLKEVA
jgi:hypothetical protein